MKYRCIIFDCDGTLVDTLEDIAASMNQALALHGFPPVPLAKYRDIVGWGIVRLATLALPEDARTEDTAQAVADCAHRIMDEQPAAQYLSRPYPGIRELLTSLAQPRQSRKIATVVLSNKPDSVLRRLMDDLFGPRAFDAVCGLRPGAEPKPDPQAVWELLAELGRNPSDAIFLGDSEIDMETARNAGCFPLGASWGFRSRATLEAAGAAQIIDRPEEIWELLRN